MANSTNGSFLTVYAQKSLEQLIANAPLVSSFTTDFSETITNGGVSVVTRIPTSTYTANDTAANGYLALPASASAVTITLKQRDITHDFTELEWATYTPSMITNTFLPPMVKSLVNNIVSDAIGLMSTSSFTTKYVSSTSTSFSSSAAFNVAQQLSTNAAPYEDRSLVLLPTYYQGMVNSVNFAYQYGSPDIIKDYRAMRLGGFNVWEYPVISTAGPSGQNLVGFGCHKSAIALAMRAPVEVNNGLVQSATATDPTSGLSIQTRLTYDQVNGKWKLTVTSIYGVAVGNTKALVPITSA